MSIPGSASPLFFKADAAAADTGYKINRSLRFNSGDSAYLSRTPSSAGNRKTWTWSGWVKRCADPSNHTALFTAGTTATDSGFFRITFHANGHINVATGATNILYDGGKLRDFSAWYHILVSVDTTASSNQVKCYVNGALYQQATAISNVDTAINSTVAHQIGRDTSETTHADIYLAEVHFVDGQALDASDFGEYDDNNVWQPKEFTGTYSTAAGPDYSSQTITNENSDYTTDKMFDGVYGSSASLDNSVIANETDGTYSVYTFANAISYSSSVRIFADFDTRSTDPDIKANNTSVTGFTDNTNTGGANKKWYTVLSGSGTLSTVSLNQHGGYVAAIFAIEVDGTVLVDNVSAGVNGFYLDFSDNSTAAALGNDSSGNDNDFTVNNFSVASGAGNDSLIDTPTNYTAASGNAGGNYATLNPLDFSSSGLSTLANGNLDAQGDVNAWQTVAATIGNLTSGKWYWEVKLGGGSGHRTGLSSVARSEASNSQLLGSGDIALNSSDGRVYVDGTEVGTGVGSLSGKTVGIALNLDANSVSFYQNGSLIHTVSSLSSTASWTPVHATRYGTVDNINFGQRPFAYTPPTDHLAIVTSNLSDPTIADGSTAMDATIWSGDGVSGRDITGLNHGPDLVWIKRRNSSSDWNLLFDAIRGGEQLASNQTDAGLAQGSNIAGYVSAYNSDGFELTQGSNLNSVNASGGTYVGWTWDAGTVANPVGDVWEGGATKYIGVKFASASGGTVVYGQTSGSTTVEVWTSSDNSNWTQQGGTLTLSDGHTLTTSDQYVYIRNTSNATFTDWYAAATNGADGHYSSQTYPGGASFTGPAYTDYDWRDEGGVVNTDGSITSIVRANQTAGFSIVSYTGTGVAGSVGHGLNAAPVIYFIKNRDTSKNWYTNTTIIDGSVDYGYLNLTDAFGNSSAGAPTSSVFNITTSHETNTSGDDHIAYCFAPVEGYSAFGSYTANASNDGPFVFTGMRPRWIMIKASSSSGDMSYASWLIVDTERDTYNVSDAGLFANKAAAEGTRGNGSGTAGTWLDILSNGFKIRYNGSEVNGVSGQTYLYIAFAQHPFKTARAR